MLALISITSYVELFQSCNSMNVCMCVEHCLVVGTCFLLGKRGCVFKCGEFMAI
jgi:hypothetical protein